MQHPLTDLSITTGMYGLCKLICTTSCSGKWVRHAFKNSIVSYISFYRSWLISWNIGIFKVSYIYTSISILLDIKSICPHHNLLVLFFLKHFSPFPFSAIICISPTYRDSFMNSRKRWSYCDIDFYNPAFPNYLLTPSCWVVGVFFLYLNIENGAVHTTLNNLYSFPWVLWQIITCSRTSMNSSHFWRTHFWNWNVNRGWFFSEVPGECVSWHSPDFCGLCVIDGISFLLQLHLSNICYHCFYFSYKPLHLP